MDFVEQLKQHLITTQKEYYDDYCKMMEGFDYKPTPFDEYIENIFRQRINCGGYALEIDACIFLYNLSFEQAVSSLLDQIPFIRLLGNTELQEDEYIVRYRTTGNGIGHHFIKEKDGEITEKDSASEIRKFDGWYETMQDRPEAVFAVKRNHDIRLNTYTISLREGRDFDEMVSEAYKSKRNSFSYHCHDYSFKRAENSIFIFSGEMKIGELLVDGDECIAVIDEGYEDFVSNTRTNYTIGKKQSRDDSLEIE